MVKDRRLAAKIHGSFDEDLTAVLTKYLAKCSLKIIKPRIGSIFFARILSLRIFGDFK